jgi:hypothetical protein
MQVAMKRPLGGVSVDMIRLREPPPLFAVSTAMCFCFV